MPRSAAGSRPCIGLERATTRDRPYYATERCWVPSVHGKGDPLWSPCSGCSDLLHAYDRGAAGGKYWLLMAVSSCGLRYHKRHVATGARAVAHFHHAHHAGHFFTDAQAARVPVFLLTMQKLHPGGV